jgi:hypothetical protein
LKFQIKSYSDAARALERERGSVLKQQHDLERYDKALANYNRELRLAKQYGLSKTRMGRLKLTGKRVMKTGATYSKVAVERAGVSTAKRAVGRKRFGELAAIYKRIVA